MLFAIQFLWQFPHFWSIAWIRYEDYLNAGIMMLPSSSGKTRLSAIQSVIYCAGLLVVSVMPYFMGLVTLWATAIVGAMGIVFLWLAIDFYKKCDDTSAKKVLYTSFLYLPVVQIAMVIGRI